MDPWSLWICGACGSMEPVDPWSLWICGACGSAEPVDLWSLWIHGACGFMEPRISRASHIGVVDPVLWILLSLY